MYWKSVTGLVAVSLAVAHAADDSSAGTIAPPNIPIADSPSDIIKLVTEAPSEGNATNSLVTLPPIDANATVTTSPVASNATMIDDVKVDAEPACSAEKDVDYVGNDLKSVLGAVGDCCTKCQGTSGCKAYSWSDYNGGTCWLKTGRGQTKTVAGVTSGVVSVVGKRVEENTDYIGNDISNVPGKDVDSCFDKCQDKSGCKAFSWSDHEGGTCWLKSARGQTKTLKGVHSAELPSGSDTSDWIVETDVDYVGNDLTDFPAKSATECKPLCSSYPNCQAYTWSDWNGGTCFLKAIRGAVKSQKGVTSGSVKYPEPSAGQCNVEQNKDYIGKDIGNAAATDASFCCKLCTVKVGCEAYTWSSWAGGRCWFKSGVTGSKNSDGAVSGKVVSGTSAPHIAYKIRSGEVPSRAVNLGGWLVTESWMSRKSPAWREFSWNDGWNGEYWAMNQYGKEKGTKLFEEHRAGWITENDIAEIASVGLNMVRVPVGFWIVDDIPGVEPTPISSVFARGALKYLDRLINEWAVKYNVGVYLSLHAHQGSQNGADHSAAQVRYQAYWSKYQNNVDNSFRMATILAARYKDVPSFVGLQLMNEPDSDTDIEVVKKYYIRSYKAIRADGNDCVIGVSPMLQQSSQNTFRDFMRWPEYSNVWVEWHVYYKWGFEKASEDQIIAAVKNYRTDHFTDWPGNWLLIGEWSLGNGEFEEKFKDKAKLKEFAEAQVQSYSEAHAGWSFWSWHHDDEYNKEADGSNTVSGWNLRQLLRLGIFKVPGY